jgi:phosphatidylglycerophosphate synthase
MKGSNWQVLRYPSTAIGMTRVGLLCFGIYWHAQDRPLAFVGLVTLSILLDMVDGTVARHRGQESRFGEVFDFGIDLTTHSVLWILSGFAFAPVMMALEWGAGISAFYLSVRWGDHWKALLLQSPVQLLRRYFSNRQRNWIAVFASISHFGFRITWYLGLGETWQSDVFLPGTILFEVVTAYIIWFAWRSSFGKSQSPEDDH